MIKKLSIGVLVVLSSMLLASCGINEKDSILSSPSSPNSSNDNGNTDEPSNVVLANQKRNGSFNLDVSLGESAQNFFGFSSLNYHSGVSLVYQTADGKMGKGENENIHFVFNPSDGKGYKDADGNDVDNTTATLNNYQSLSKVFGFFDYLTSSPLGGMMVAPSIPSGTSDNISPTYKAPAAYYYSLKDLTSEQASDLGEELSLYYLKGEDFYFADTNSKAKASDGSHDQLRAFGQEKIKSTDFGSIFEGISQIIGGESGESLDASTILSLLTAFVPEGEFDTSDNKTLIDISRTLDVLLTGIKGKKETVIDESGAKTIFTIQLNQQALDKVNNEMLPALVEEAGDAGAALAGAKLDDINMSFTSQLGNDNNTYVTDFKFNVSLSNMLMGMVTPKISLDLSLDPSTTKVEDDYFSKAKDTLDFYSGLNDQFLAYYNQVKPYVKFIGIDKPEANIDLSALDEGEKTWADLKTQYGLLSEDSKFMLGNSITADTFTADDPFKLAQERLDKVTLPEGGITQDNIESVFGEANAMGSYDRVISNYKNWRTALENYEKTKPVFDSLEAAYKENEGEWETWSKELQALESKVYTADDLNKLYLKLITEMPADWSGEFVFFTEEEQNTLTGLMAPYKDSATQAKVLLKAFTDYLVKNRTVIEGKETKTFDYKLLVNLGTLPSYTYDEKTHEFTLTSDGSGDKPINQSTFLQNLFSNNENSKGVYQSLDEDTQKAWKDDFFSKIDSTNLALTLKDWGDAINGEAEDLLTKSNYQSAQEKQALSDGIKKVQQEIDSLEALTPVVTDYDVDNYTKNSKDILASVNLIKGLVPDSGKVDEKNKTFTFDGSKYKIEVQKDGKAYALDDKNIQNKGKDGEVVTFIEKGSYVITLRNLNTSYPYSLTV